MVVSSLNGVDSWCLRSCWTRTLMTLVWKSDSIAVRHLSEYSVPFSSGSHPGCVLQGHQHYSKKRSDNFVQILRPNNNCKGLTPVVVCGVLRYTTWNLSNLDFQSRPSAWANQRFFNIDLFWCSISPFVCGHKGVFLGNIVFQYVILKMLTNWGPLSV